MDICVICGKPREGIVLELEEDDGQIRERLVCKSCWEVMASIAVKVVTSELKPLISELEPLIEFVAELKKLDSDMSVSASKYRDTLFEIEKTTAEMEETASRLEDLIAKDDELYGDEEIDNEELKDDEFSNDEATVAGVPNDVLVDQLLSFAKEMDINQDEADALSRDVVELFWKSKGIRSEFSASAEIRAKF